MRFLSFEWNVKKLKKQEHRVTYEMYPPVENRTGRLMQTT